MFSDVAMLLCAPMGETHAAVAVSDSRGSEHSSMAHASHAGMAQDALAAGESTDGQEDGDQPLPHDHGSCNFCCAHGQPDLASFPALALREGAPARAIAPETFVQLYLSTTPHLQTLPNPPPVA
jgi:hypothetical protein